jgi:hypothetical protein
MFEFSIALIFGGMVGFEILTKDEDLEINGGLVIDLLFIRLMFLFFDEA